MKMWKSVSGKGLITLMAVISVLITDGLKTAGAQSLKKTFRFCQTQFESGKYQNAIEAGRRVMFFDTASRYKDSTSKILGKAYFMLGRFIRSAHYYDLAYEYTSTKEGSANRFLLSKAKALLMNKDYNLAKAELLSIPSKLEGQKKREKSLLLGIAAYKKGSFDNAERHFLKAMPQSDSARIAQLFRENDRLKRYDSWVPRIMSLLIPGSGQMVLGDFKNGLNSLLLTGGIYALFISTARTYSVLEAIIGVYPTFHRYYMGGYEKVRDIQLRKKAKKRHKIYQQLLSLYEKNKQ
jgi:tetratricopeptide (TPR) repeat protein